MYCAAHDAGDQLQQRLDVALNDVAEAHAHCRSLDAELCGAQAALTQERTRSEELATGLAAAQNDSVRSLLGVIVASS